MDQHWHLEQVATYLYILACQNDTFYVGITHDLALRYKQHIGGRKGAPHTQVSGVDRIVAVRLFPNREKALVAENFVTYYFKIKRQSTCSDADVLSWLDQYYPFERIDVPDLTTPLTCPQPKMRKHPKVL